MGKAIAFLAGTTAAMCAECVCMVYTPWWVLPLVALVILVGLIVISAVAVGRDAEREGI